MEMTDLFIAHSASPIGAVAIALLLAVHHSNGPHEKGAAVALVFTDSASFFQFCLGLFSHFTSEYNDVKPLPYEPREWVCPEDALDTPPPTPRRPAVSVHRVSPDRDRGHDGFLGEILEGLNEYEPQLCAEGTNGTYFLKNVDGRVIGVFKPEDEEGDSPNNPRERMGDSSDRGVLPGEAAVREVVVHRLDQRLGGFFGVPSTLMVSVDHPSFVDKDGRPVTKRGSLQQFVDSEGCASDLGPSAFPAEEVHRLAALDMLIYNTDRHDGNILYDRDDEGRIRLIPIDHGFSLPDRLGSAWYDWMSYPQASKPFDTGVVEKISQLDVEEFSREMSQEFSIRPECIETFKISSALLKIGSAMGKSPRQLGRFSTRMNPKEISPLEALVREARDVDGDFMENVTRMMEQKLRDL